MVAWVGEGERGGGEVYKTRFRTTLRSRHGHWFLRARDKNSGHAAVSRDIAFAEIKRALKRLEIRPNAAGGRDIDVWSTSNRFEIGGRLKRVRISLSRGSMIPPRIAYKAILSDGNPRSSGIDSILLSGRTCFPRNNVDIMPGDRSSPRAVIAFHFGSVRWLFALLWDARSE